MYAQHRRARPLRTALVLATAVAGVATAGLVSLAVAGTFTLKVATHASVTNVSGVTKHESIVVTSTGFAVYILTGDSPRHQKCIKSNGCFAAWPPVKASSAKKLSKAPGVNGKLGTFRRDGFVQVTLDGHPLYVFIGDRHKDAATGEGINHFGGIWHVIKMGGSSGATPPGTSTSSTSTSPSPSSTTTSSTTSYGY
jgi:predicted lipoprotein with Yx(FWY)xxD motif